MLCEVGRKPFSPVAVCHLSSKLRHKMLQRLRSREKRVHGADWPEVDEAMLEYVVNQASAPADRKSHYCVPLPACPLATRAGHTLFSTLKLCGRYS